MTIRLIRHDTIVDGRDLQCGSFEVRFADGRPSRYFYWDDIKGRRLREEAMTQDQAKVKAQALARAEQDKLEKP